MTLSTAAATICSQSKMHTNGHVQLYTPLWPSGGLYKQMILVIGLDEIVFVNNSGRYTVKQFDRDTRPTSHLHVVYMMVVT